MKNDNIIECASSMNDLKEYLSGYNMIVIYGAGVYGKRVLRQLYNWEIGKKILFAETSINEIKEVSGIPVYSIEEFGNCTDKFCVVIAASEQYSKQMSKCLSDLGLKDYYAISEIQRAYLRGFECAQIELFALEFEKQRGVLIKEIMLYFEKKMVSLLSERIAKFEKNLTLLDEKMTGLEKRNSLLKETSSDLKKEMNTFSEDICNSVKTLYKDNNELQLDMSKELFQQQKKELILVFQQQEVHLLGKISTEIATLSKRMDKLEQLVVLETVSLDKLDKIKQILLQEETLDKLTDI